jgi:hypothetical protein
MALRLVRVPSPLCGLLLLPTDAERHAVLRLPAQLACNGLTALSPLAAAYNYLHEHGLNTSHLLAAAHTKQGC